MWGTCCHRRIEDGVNRRTETSNPTRGAGAPLVFAEERDCAKQGGVVAEFRGSHLYFAPRGPGVFLHVGLDVGNNDVGALHDAAADDDDLRIEGVHEADGIGGPDVEAAVADGEGDFIAALRFFEKFLEAHFRVPGQCTLIDVRPVSDDERQRPAAGFGFGATDGAAITGAPVKDRGDVPAETAGLTVLAAEEFALDHGDAADAGTEGHHDGIGVTAGGAGIDFAEKSETGVIFEPERKAESFAAPCIEVEVFRVGVFIVGSQNLSDAAVDQCRHADADSGAILEIERCGFQEFLKGFYDARQDGNQTFRTIRVEGFVTENGSFIHQTAGGVRASEINSESLHSMCSMRKSRMTPKLDLLNISL